MKRLISYLILASGPVGTMQTLPIFASIRELPTDETQKNKPVTINVLLHEKERSLLLEVKGSYKIFCPYSDVLLSSGSSAKRAFITPSATGLSWGNIFPGSKGFRIVPTTAATSIFINGIQYKGCMEIYDIDGSLRVVNEVDVENYLKSCLATEKFPTEEPEALNALAIVLRTQTYYQIEQNGGAPWHVSAEQSRYRGFAITGQNPALERALSATRHAVLTYKNKPFPAVWSEDAAGVTSSFAFVFKKNVACPKGVRVPGMDSERLKSAWSFQISKEQLAKIAKLAQVSSIDTLAEKKSGKVQAVKVDNGTDTRTLDFFALQNALGTQSLKSNDFTIELLDNTVRFKGYGRGPGVGLCLHSAELMAKQGMNAKEILSKFFEEASLERIDRISL